MQRLLGTLLLVALVFPAPVFGAVDLRVSVGSGDRKIVVFEEGVTSEEQAALLRETAAIRETEVLDALDAAIVVTSSEQASDQLRNDPRVKRVDNDVEVYALGHRSSVPSQVVGWGMDRIGAPAAWARSTGSGIRVAILDSGIDLDHPDLSRNIHGGYNALFPGRSADDDNGHGTHVAGVVAAVNNSYGSVGVAVDTSLYAVKVLDRRGRGYISDIIEGLDWAVGNGMNVVNLSLGTSADIPSLREAVDRTSQAGVLVVAAAGNSGGEVLYPARYDRVVAVGMVDAEGIVHRKSSRGEGLDLVAPGVDVYSTYKNGRYREITGTSMASPHVAGVAALLFAAPQFCDADRDGWCSSAEVAERIRTTAVDLGPGGWDEASGVGLVNASRALGL